LIRDANIATARDTHCLPEETFNSVTLLPQTQPDDQCFSGVEAQPNGTQPLRNVGHALSEPATK